MPRAGFVSQIRPDARRARFVNGDDWSEDGRIVKERRVLGAHG